MRKDQAEVTIGVLCYDVYLKDSCYLVFLISYRIDRNGFCFTDFCERFRKNLVAEHSVVSKMYSDMFILLPLLSRRLISLI
jgi:hypothetical protein